MSNAKEQVVDKVGEPIREGDEVWTKMRGGKHEGTVRSLPIDYSDQELTVLGGQHCD